MSTTRQFSIWYSIILFYVTLRTHYSKPKRKPCHLAAAISRFGSMRSASSWPRDLSGIFGTLVIDEAHTLRNRNTAQWTAAHAINAKSTTLATATPLFNSFKDFGALYPSLIPSSNESTRYYVDPKLNPFLIQFFYFMMYRCRKTDCTLFGI